MKLLKYILIGIYFGFILLKSEAVSWFRIVEMFHFQSFHMFGVIGSAITVGIVAVFLLKRIDPQLVSTQKPYEPKRNLIGGIFFWLRLVIGGRMYSTFVSPSGNR